MFQQCQARNKASVIIEFYASLKPPNFPGRIAVFCASAERHIYLYYHPCVIQVLVTLSETARFL